MNYKLGFHIVLLILIIFCFFWWINKPVTPPVKETITEALELKKSLLRTIIASGLDKNGEAIVVKSSTGEKVVPCEDGPVIVPVEEIYPDIKQDKTTINKSVNSDCLVQFVEPSEELRSAIKASKSILEGTVLKDGKEVPAKFIVQVTALYTGSVCRTHHVGGNQHNICINETDLCQDMLEDAIYYDDEELLNEVKADCEV